MPNESPKSVDESFTSHLVRIRNRATSQMTGILFLSLALVGVESGFMTLFNKLTVFIMVGLVFNNMLCSCYGYNALFYADKNRLKIFRFWHLFGMTLILGLVICQGVLTFLLADSANITNPNKKFVFPLVGVCFLLIIILEILLTISVGYVIQLQVAEKPALPFKKATLDKKAYGSQLEKSLMLDSTTMTHPA